MRGFFLVEALISVAIFMFFGLVLFGVFYEGNIICRTNTVLLAAQQQARNAADYIVRELRESKSSTPLTTADADRDTLAFLTPNETTSPGIQYALQDVVKNGVVVETNLVRTYASDPLLPTRTVARNIVRLKFTKDNVNKKITINITARQTIGTRNYDYLLSENVRLRNE